MLKLIEDKEIALQLTKQDYAHLSNCNSKLQDDEEVVLQALKTLESINSKPKDTKNPLSELDVLFEDSQYDVIGYASPRIQEICDNSPTQPLETLEKIVLKNTLSEELPVKEHQTAKDRYLEDFAKQSNGTSRTKSGSLKI